jgi:hypothetical protein
MKDVADVAVVETISGDISNGGWRCTLTSLRDTDILIAHQGVNVSWRPSLGGSFGSPLPGFVGHVTSRKISFTEKYATAEYEASTTDVLLRKSWMQGIHFRDMGAGVRSHFHQFDDASGNLTLGKIVRHILGYLDGISWVSHTNAVFNASWNRSGWINIDDVMTTPFDVGTNPLGSMRTDSFIVDETSNIWTTLQAIADNEFFTIYFDKANNLHYKRHPMFQETLPDPVMTLTKAHFVGAPDIEMREEYGAYAENGIQIVLHAVTDEGSTLHSYSPANGELRVQGTRIEHSYLRCNSQTTLDFWARRLYDYESRECTLRVVLPGMSGLLFELLDRVAVTYAGTTATGLHIDWTAKKFWVHKIDVTPQQSILVLEAENSSI